MLNNNLLSLSINNSLLAKRLGSMTLDDCKNITANKSQSDDFIILDNNVPLDDVVNPLEQAKETWEKYKVGEINNNDVVVIYGLGLGYLFKRAYISTNANIIVYEPSFETLHFVFNYIDFSNELRDERVNVIQNYDDLIRQLRLKKTSDNKIIPVFNGNYIPIYSKEIIKFTNDLENLIKETSSNTLTTMMNAKLWTKNILNNLKNLDKFIPLENLKNKFSDFTCIITAPGPSLAKDISFIKENRDRLFILSLNKSADFLSQNDITPDFIICADADYVYETVSSIKNLDKTNIIMSIKAQNKILELKANSFITYFPKNTDFIVSLTEHFKDKISLFNSATTTAIYSYYIAKLLNFKNIVFSGLDLALKDGIIYSDSEKDLQEKTLFGKSRFSLIEVDSVNNSKVLTRADYLSFKNQLEYILEKENAHNIYNTSDFGAKVKGMTYIETKDIPLSDIPKTDYLKETKTFANISADINKYIDDIITEAKTILDKFPEVIENNKFIINNFLNNNSSLIYPVTYVMVENKSTELLSEVMKNKILSEYFQKEIYDYLNQVETLTVRNNKDFASIKEYENNLLEKIYEEAPTILK